MNISVSGHAVSLPARLPAAIAPTAPVVGPCLRRWLRDIRDSAYPMDFWLGAQLPVERPTGLSLRLVRAAAAALADCAPAGTRVEVLLSIDDEVPMTPVLNFPDPHHGDPAVLAARLPAAVAAARSDWHRTCAQVVRWGWLLPWGAVRRALLRRAIAVPAGVQRIGVSHLGAGASADFGVVRSAAPLLVLAGGCVGGQLPVRLLADHTYYNGRSAPGGAGSAAASLAQRAG
jgi:hypothetical protein